jgi:hypothetical protein
MSSEIDRDFARLEAGDAITTPTQAQPRASVRARALALARKPLLDLATVAPLRPTIRIDGLDYRLPLYEDFSLWQHSRLANLSGRAGEPDALALADDADEVTVEQWAELDRLSADIYGEMVATILPDVPAPTRAALTLPQRQAIIREFFALNQSRSAEATPAASDAPPTGAKSLPPSAPASATGAGGRGKRRSASLSPRIGASGA